MTHNIFPYEMLDFVSGYLRNRLNLDPLSEILNGDDEILHLA